MARITNLTLTDSGELYNTIPTVTISAPDRPTGAASGTALVDSSGVVTSVSIVDSGAYYLSAPAINVKPNPNPAVVPNNFRFDSDFKLFNYGSYALGRVDHVDSDYTNFAAGQDNNLSFEFFISVPTRFEGDSVQEEDSDTLGQGQWQNGDSATIIRFKGPHDATGAKNYVKLRDSAGQATITWNWTENNGADEVSLATSGFDVAAIPVYRFVQLSKVAANGDSGGPIHKIHINGVERATTLERDSSLTDSNISNSITLVNTDNTWRRLETADDVTANAINLDSILLRKFDSGGLVDFISTPDSDRSRDSNFEGFDACNASITSTIDSEGRVSALTIVNGGQDYLPNVSLSLVTIAPSGSASDFQATAVCTIDSSTRKVSSLTLTDSGGNYITAPTVTIGVPRNIIDFQVGERVTQTLDSASGFMEVEMEGTVASWSDSDKKLHIIHSGADDGKYHSWIVTPTSSNTNLGVITGNTSGASGAVTAVVEDNQISQNEQNTFFDTEANSFLDFSESNPFGDPQ